MSFVFNPKTIEMEAAPKEWWYYAYERTLQQFKKDRVRPRPGSPYKTVQQLAGATTGWNWWHNITSATRQRILKTVKADRAIGKIGVITAKGRKTRKAVTKKLGAAASKRVYSHLKLKKAEITGAKGWAKPKKAKKATKKIAARKTRKTVANPLNRKEALSLFKDTKHHFEWAKALEEQGDTQRAYAAYIKTKEALDILLSYTRFEKQSWWRDAHDIAEIANRRRIVLGEKIDGCVRGIKPHQPNPLTDEEFTELLTNANNIATLAKSYEEQGDLLWAIKCYENAYGLVSAAVRYRGKDYMPFGYRKALKLVKTTSFKAHSLAAAMETKETAPNPQLMLMLNPGTGLYVGAKKRTFKYEVFKSKKEPTKKSHGAKYAYVIGPFRTKRGAQFMAKYGKDNPHCQTVEQAEQLAKLTVEGKISGATLPNPGICGICGGELIPMGGLGNIMYFRCRQCGMQWSKKVKPHKRKKAKKNPMKIPVRKKLTEAQRDRLINLYASGPLFRKPIDTKLVKWGWAIGGEVYGEKPGETVWGAPGASSHFYDKTGVVYEDLYPTKRRKSKKTAKSSKTKRNPKVQEITLAELEQQFPVEYKEAAAKYKKFHKTMPRTVKVVDLPGAPLKGNTILVALGASPEAVYKVPKHSKKQSKIAFKHDFENPVVKCTDAKGDILLDIPVGEKGYKVTDWIRH